MFSPLPFGRGVRGEGVSARHKPSSPTLSQRESEPSKRHWATLVVAADLAPTWRPSLAACRMSPMRELRTAPTRAEALATAAERIDLLQNAIERVIRGKPEAVRLAMVTLLAGGHLLVEDVPGVGKTTLAHALARALDCSFQRIQFTSDLLPSDVIGLSVFNQTESLFEWK